LRIGALLVLVLFCFACKAAPRPHETDSIEEDEAEDFVFEMPTDGTALPVSAFGEIWAYVVAGREAALTSSLPISDIGYFGADISTYGALIDVPDRKKLRAFSGRVHMVVKCDSRSLAYFTLMPGSAERKTLITDLVAASRNFDGLQIDFENIPQRAGDSFHSFLAELKEALGNSIYRGIARPVQKNQR